MKRLSAASAVRVLGLLLALSSRAEAQCPDWRSGFHLGGTDGDIFSLAVFDDGSGSALYAGGRFSTVGTVGAQNIARWDGSAWSSVGSGMTGGGAGSTIVSALCVFDDGSGPALYAGGRFTTAGGVPAVNLAKWDGSTWSPVGGGTNSNVHALTVHDDGSGPALYAGGSFDAAGGIPANRIARWDGSDWSSLGAGIGSEDVYESVSALCVFDEGSGPRLFASGSFTLAGGAAANNIARWSGTAWSSLGSGTNALVGAMCVFDGGSGPELHVGGAFTTAGGIAASQIARWNGSTWSPLGSGMGSTGAVSTLSVFDDGLGPALHAGGTFTTAGGAQANRIAKWDGSAWSSLGSGMNAQVNVLAVFDDGSGPALHACGLFTTAGEAIANHVARWDDSTWSAVGGGFGMNNTVFAMTVFDDGSGTALHVGGAFTSAGVTSANAIAKWNGSSWSSHGSGMGNSTSFPPAIVHALVAYDDGSGQALYAGGSFISAGGLAANNIAKWNGTSWSPLGSGIDDPGQVYTLAAFEDGAGPALYAGGSFTSAGGVPANHVARWDGSSWSPLGSGLSGLSNARVEALAVFDDGTGPALYVGGEFDSAGGVPVSKIAKWTGNVWLPVGSGMSGPVQVLAVYDDGAGAALYAGGLFNAAGGTSAASIAKWDGSSWSNLGSGLTGQWAEVSALAAFDDGAGTKLYAAGRFTTAGTVPANGIARWNGGHWSSPGIGLEFPGLPPLAEALGVFEIESVPTLFVGGLFYTAGGEFSRFIAAWSGCPGNGDGTPFCFGDGAPAACPCGNNGSPGHGCQNSSSTGGALLEGEGGASLAADTVVLTSSGEKPTALSIFLQGDTDVDPAAPFGDGLRCVGGTLKRLFVKNAVAGVVVAPSGADLSVSARSAAAGDPILAGEARSYQVYYRDSAPAFCPSPPGSTFNASQAVRLLWAP